MTFIGKEEWEKLERLESESIEALRTYDPEISMDIGSHIKYLHESLNRKDVEGIRSVRRAAIRLGHDSLLYFAAVCEDGIRKGYDPTQLPTEETERIGSRLVSYDEKLEALKNSLGHDDGNGRRGFVGDHVRTREVDTEPPSSTGSLYRELFWDAEVDLPFYVIAPKVIAFVNNKSVSDMRRFHTNQLENGVLREAINVEEADELKDDFYRRLSSDIVRVCAANRFSDPNLLKDLVSLGKAAGDETVVARTYKPVVAYLLRDKEKRDLAFQLAEIVGLQIRPQFDAPPAETQN